MSQRIILRRATLADLPILRLWDNDPGVVAAGGSDGGWDWEAELPQEDPNSELLIAELDSRPLGFMQIIDPQLEKSHYWGEIGAGFRAIDIWIGEAADRNQGHGTEMMRLALDRCFSAAGVQAVLIDPLTRNTATRRFYERLGFRETEQRWFDDDNCTIYRFDRRQWQG